MPVGILAPRKRARSNTSSSISKVSKTGSGSRSVRPQVNRPHRSTHSSSELPISKPSSESGMTGMMLLASVSGSTKSEIGILEGMVMLVYKDMWDPPRLNSYSLGIRVEHHGGLVLSEKELDSTEISLVPNCLLLPEIRDTSSADCSARLLAIIEGTDPLLKRFKIDKTRTHSISWVLNVMYDQSTPPLDQPDQTIDTLFSSLVPLRPASKLRVEYITKLGLTYDWSQGGKIMDFYAFVKRKSLLEDEPNKSWGTIGLESFVAREKAILDMKLPELKLLRYGKKQKQNSDPRRGSVAVRGRGRGRDAEQDPKRRDDRPEIVPEPAVPAPQRDHELLVNDNSDATNQVTAKPLSKGAHTTVGSRAVHECEEISDNAHRAPERVKSNETPSPQPDQDPSRSVSYSDSSHCGDSDFEPDQPCPDWALPLEIYPDSLPVPQGLSPSVPDLDKPPSHESIQPSETFLDTRPDSLVAGGPVSELDHPLTKGITLPFVTIPNSRPTSPVFGDSAPGTDRLVPDEAILPLEASISDLPIGERSSRCALYCAIFAEWRVHCVDEVWLQEQVRSMKRVAQRKLVLVILHEAVAYLLMAFTDGQWRLDTILRGNAEESARSDFETFALCVSDAFGEQVLLTQRIAKDEDFAAAARALRNMKASA